MSDTLQTCPVCGVSIAEDGTVNFSTGNPGTRARLYARVCQYTQNEGCINQDTQLIGELSSADKFEEGKDLAASVANSLQSDS